LIFLDSGFRRNDETGVNQPFFNTLLLDSGLRRNDGEEATNKRP
jgi:hypothetical protein